MRSSSTHTSEIEDPTRNTNPSLPCSSPLSSLPSSPSLSPCLIPSCPSNGPRLPTELLLQIFLSHSLSPILSPTPQTFSTLQALLATCRLARECAGEQLYSVLILPRRVIDFRRYYDRERQRGWLGAGRTRGLFCALDDVSRLTHTSAGWETAFLRTLHILGPTITHLSLWHSESRTLFRDAGQIRSKRNLENGEPAWAWGGEEDELDSDEESEEDDEHISPITGQPVTPSDPAESSSLTVEQSSEEAAAMRERARQRLPKWLEAELTSSSSTGEVARRHRAHLLPLGDPSDIAHSSSDGSNLLESHLVAQRRFRLQRDRRLHRGCRPEALSIVLSLPLFENQEPALFASLIVFSRCQELDVYMPVPAHASKLLYLVSHLHRSPLRKLKITTNHFSLCLGLGPFTRAGEIQRRRAEEAKKRRRKRCMRQNFLLQAASHAKEAEQQGGDEKYSVREGNVRGKVKRPINLATSLRLLLESETIREALLWEFAGQHYDRLETLKRVIREVALESRAVDPEMFVRIASASGSKGGRRDGCEGRGELAEILGKTSLSRDTPHPPPRGDGLPKYGVPSGEADDDDAEDDLLRVTLLQGNQGGAGKMKERKEDFIQRSMGRGHGIWKKCGLWDD